MGSRACRLTIPSPALMYCPRSTLRMPSRPSNGARMILRLMTASCCLTRASAASNWARISSNSDLEVTFFFSRFFERSNCTWLSFFSARRASSAAESTDTSSLSKTSSAFTGLPDSNRISLMMPSTSVLTWMPCVATSEPTEASEGSRISCITLVVLTTPGGGGG